jgi:hypothetical protein
MPPLHDRTLGIALLRLSSFLALLNLSDHSLESFADVLVVARAGFGEAAAQLFGEFLAVGERHLALFGAQVGFVADDCEGDGVGALGEERMLAEVHWVMCRTLCVAVHRIAAHCLCAWHN